MKTSRFYVLSQRQIAQAVPDYPQLIKGPYKASLLRKSMSISRRRTGRGEGTCSDTLRWITYIRLQGAGHRSRKEVQVRSSKTIS